MGPSSRSSLLGLAVVVRVDRRVIKRHSLVQAYLDSLAVVVELGLLH
jgi:hypothetical protein